MATATTDYAETVCALTEEYLEQVTEVTGRLPNALDAYDSDPDAFARAVDAIGSRESACDATLRELRTVVRESMPPNYTDLYLRIDDVARLYDAIDAVPNSVERFVRELDAIEPALDDAVRAILSEMATLTARAAETLAEVVATYVESLVSEATASDVTEAVETMATLESECDGLKYEALAAAFDSLPTAEALVVRELVLTLDAAMDAVEDAGDHLLFTSSADL